jgi:hypothetical protein
MIDLAVQRHSEVRKKRLMRPKAIARRSGG